MRTKKQKLKRRQPGFTLIDLMVTVSIMSFIASIMLVAVVKARIKSRDVRRISDMRQIQTALDVYYDKNNLTYPNPDPDGAGLCGGWDISNVDVGNVGGLFINSLKVDGEVAKAPTDPLNDGGGCGYHAYRYYRYAAGAYGCDISKGPYYVLGINNFEGSLPAPNPDWACTGNWGSNGLPSDPDHGPRAWSSEFQWVTGKYEK